MMHGPIPEDVLRLGPPPLVVWGMPGHMAVIFGALGWAVWRYYHSRHYRDLYERLFGPFADY